MVSVSEWATPSRRRMASTAVTARRCRRATTWLPNSARSSVVPGLSRDEPRRRPRGMPRRRSRPSSCVAPRVQPPRADLAWVWTVADRGRPFRGAGVTALEAAVGAAPRRLARERREGRPFPFPSTSAPAVAAKDLLSRRRQSRWRGLWLSGAGHVGTLVTRWFRPDPMNKPRTGRTELGADRRGADTDGSGCFSGDSADPWEDACRSTGHV